LLGALLLDDRDLAEMATDDLKLLHHEVVRVLMRRLAERCYELDELLAQLQGVLKTVERKPRKIAAANKRPSAPRSL
jgi:hypothetical protein